MSPQETYDMENISLKEYLMTVIRMKEEHILELMQTNKEYVKEAFDLYEKNVQVHLERLNHSHENIKEIAAKNISQDKFDSLHRELILRFDNHLTDSGRRFDEMEKSLSVKGVENKSTIAVIVMIGGIIASALTIFITHLIK